MARSRNIKPGFFQDDKLGELPIFSRMAFIGLWTLANFKGCLEFRPKMLKVQILPYDDCDIEKVINALEQARFIRYYSVEGKKYIKIVNFEKHQNPHKNERDAGTDIPDINENNELKQDGTKTDLIGSNPADSLVLIPSTLIPDKHKKNSRTMLTELGVEDQIAKDWLEIRRAKRAPLTQTALDELVREAGKAGISVNEAVRICASKTWQGFNASWNWKENASGNGKSDLPWWSTNELMLAKGKEFNTEPRPGEGWNEFKSRLSKLVSDRG